jgi:hypothetical protein
MKRLLSFTVAAISVVAIAGAQSAPTPKTRVRCTLSDGRWMIMTAQHVAIKYAEPYARSEAGLATCRIGQQVVTLPRFAGLSSLNNTVTILVG